MGSGTGISRGRTLGASTVRGRLPSIVEYEGGAACMHWWRRRAPLTQPVRRRGCGVVGSGGWLPSSGLRQGGSGGEPARCFKGVRTETALGWGCVRADSKARPCRRMSLRRPGRLCKLAYRLIVHISIVGVCLLAVEWLLVRRLCGLPSSVCAYAWSGAFAHRCRGQVKAKAGHLLLHQAAAAASIEAWLAPGLGAWGREGLHPTARCRRKTGSGSSPMLPTV